MTPRTTRVRFSVAVLLKLIPFFLVFLFHKRMVVDELTEEEQQIAARTSYAYWAAELLAQKQDETKRIRMAMREARRHYVGENGNYATALDRLKRTLLWRMERQVDLIRLCFANNTGVEATATPLQPCEVELSQEDAEVCSRFERLIETDLQIQPMVVRGYDRENRPIVIKLSRQQKWNVDDETARETYESANLYVAERATANSEFLSRGMGEKITPVFDFADYSSANSPPLTEIVNTVKMMQANYPERIGRALILDAPFWMQAVFKILSPFLAERTRKQLSVLGAAGSDTALLSMVWPLGGGISSTDTRDETVRAVVDPEQAMPFMLKDARLTTELDLDHQLRRVPFHVLYDF